MAKACIAEFERPQDGPGFPMQLAFVNNYIEQTDVTIGAEAKSAAFTYPFVRVAVDAACRVKGGSTAPTATTGSAIRMAAGQTEYFFVKPGDKLSFIAE